MSVSPRNWKAQSNARNAAFFFGAMGASLGAFGGGFTGLFVAIQPGSEFARSLPDWVFLAFVIAWLTAVVGIWPFLDWLLNRDTLVGSLALLGLAAGLAVLGLLGLNTVVEVTAWLTLTAVPLLLIAAWLAHRGGGTDPLTWTALNE